MYKKMNEFIAEPLTDTKALCLVLQEFKYEYLN